MKSLRLPPAVLSRPPAGLAKTSPNLPRPEAAPAQPFPTSCADSPLPGKRKDPPMHPRSPAFPYPQFPQ